MATNERKLGPPIPHVETGTLDLPQGIVLAIADLLRAAPQIALAGDIAKAGGLADIIGFIHQNRWSGKLRVIEPACARELRFLAGEVRGASSTQNKDRFGEILFRFGRVQRPELDRALSIGAGTRRVGQVLVDMGLLSTHDVFFFVKKQIEEIFLALLSVRSGAYIFEREDAANADREHAADLGLSTRQLLFDGARQLDEMQHFKERIPSETVIPVRRAAAGKVVPLGEELRAVLSLVDGARTVEEIGRDSQLGVRDATRALFQLIQAGHVEISDESEILTDRSGGPKRLVEFVNSFLATVQETLVACGTPQLLKSELDHFLSSTSKYGGLFRGVTIGPDVQLPEAKILENLERSDTPDPALYLQRGFHEMLCFLLFVVGDAVGPQRQKQLSLILLDADRTRRSTQEASKVKVVVAGRAALATLAVDNLEQALSTRDLASDAVPHPPSTEDVETVDISSIDEA